MAKKKPAPEEPRFPDLGREDDLNHPINRLLGIDNYCNVLINTYAEDTQRWRDERRSSEVLQSLNPDDLYWKDRARHCEAYEKVCEQWFRHLRELSNAMRVAMPDILIER
jgi:hypothetical protein